jgi:hypothetical protein
MNRNDPALAALALLGLALELVAVALRPLLAHALALLLTAAGWRPTTQKEAAAANPAPLPTKPTKNPPAPVRAGRTRKRPALAVA